MRPIALALLLSLTPMHALASQEPLELSPAPAPLTEAQKRKLRLPYVRAATDCVARAIASNSAALDFAGQGRWADAATGIGPICREPIARMIREHDRLYGEGTGDPFFQDAYLPDLPRALAARLKPVFDRRVAQAQQAEAARRTELARQETERKHQLEGKLLNVLFNQCR